MTPNQQRPLVVLLASHWISMLGVALATTAGFSWLFILPQHLNGSADNPYIGILVFLVIPALLIAGLILIPIGIVLARRRVAHQLSTLAEPRAAWRRIGLFLGLITFVNLVIGSQASYRAVQHMETVQFCGESCHVMKPEFTAWSHAPHSHVQCAECHIAPGASGWFAAKMAGTHQLMAVVFNTFPRPLESGIQSNKLVRSEETCERCHARERELGSIMKVSTTFKGDEHNTRSENVLMMLVGGKNSGIHGAHLGPGVHVRYAVADGRREVIPWVEYTGPDGKVSTFVDSSFKGSLDSLPRYTMECADCHNRPAHSFESAGRAVDKALASGQIPVAMPFIRRNAVEALTRAKSAEEIPAQLAKLYGGSAPAGLDAVTKVITDIYNRNVFPDLKVTWGTYSSNLGHPSVTGEDAGNNGNGCFRCHDGGHVRAGDKLAITQDCSTCHRVVAEDEARPAVLKTLGLE